MFLLRYKVKVLYDPQVVSDDRLTYPTVIAAVNFISHQNSPASRRLPSRLNRVTAYVRHLQFPVVCEARRRQAAIECLVYMCCMLYADEYM